ncbi:sulfatase-like hydrolase/transferase [bacterium]|nr:sulfatase-like hydrolase/transferase [bacterium]
MDVAAKPNILFVYADQHRYDCTGVNGHPLVQTPAMDGLAREGANFSHAFTPIPICVPARCSLLSGRWPTEHGTIFNYDGETFKPFSPEQPTCARAVRDAGYHAIHIGRWHVDPKLTPVDYGFHDYVPEWRYGQWRKARGLKPAPRSGFAGAADTHISAAESRPVWSANQVIRFLEYTREYPDPVFIHWHLTEPHLPCDPPEPFASMYDPKSITPWPGFNDSFEGKPLIQRQMLRTWNVENMTWDDWAPIVARYLGVVSLVDHALGLVLDTLDRLGMRENTLVIYTSDHGDMCGSHRMVDKHYVMYDDVVRVPMMMRWPGVVPAGATCGDFVSNAVDLATTFCHVAGAAIPASFSGTVLFPFADKPAKGKRGDIFASYHGNQFGSFSQRMVRDRRWKYVWNATCEDELYDLDADPGELKNRVADQACAPELSRLRLRMLDWMGSTHDTLNNGMIRRQLCEGRKLTA